jgi:hypothetical protein
MSTQRQDPRPGPIRRRAALAGVIAALATAVPSTEADAALPFPVSPTIGRVAFVYGGLAVGDVFNGGTTVVVSTSTAVGTTAYSP